MTDLILHHYPTSPFAEKVRKILAYKGLAWKSVTIPRIMPKPDVVALTGGYRRTPILQIGADVYCDTALIAEVLERIAPVPTLYPGDRAGEARLIAHWADSALFWAAVPYTLSPVGMPILFAGVAPEDIKAFGADRAVFRGSAPRLAVPDLEGHVRNYAAWIEGLLSDGRNYAVGSAPSIADFSLYHAVWFMHRAPPVAATLAAHKKLIAWFERMRAIEGAPGTEISSAEAIEIAAGAKSMAATRIDADSHGCAAGDRVAVMPTDTGLDPVEGELVLSTANEIALRRADPRAGEVVVHFPRVGFQMKKLAPA